MDRQIAPMIWRTSHARGPTKPELPRPGPAPGGSPILLRDPTAPLQLQRSQAWIPKVPVIITAWVAKQPFTNSCSVPRTTIPLRLGPLHQEWSFREQLYLICCLAFQVGNEFRNSSPNRVSLRWSHIKTE